MPSKKSRVQTTSRKDRELAGWIVGFVDGEGCFSVSKFRNPTTRSGYQTFPEFVVTQGKRSRAALELIKNYFQCGQIYINRRHDNHHEHLLRYCVRAISDLHEKIIPFFEKHRLKTKKIQDFDVFQQTVRQMIFKRASKRNPQRLHARSRAKTGKI